MDTYYLTPGHESGFHHTTGGTGQIKVACPLCNHTLSLVFGYDLADQRLGLGDWGVDQLPCLYCMHCDMWEIQYRVTSAGIEVLAEEGIPDEVDYSRRFPGAEKIASTALRLERISDELQDIAIRIDGAGVTRNEKQLFAEWHQRIFEWETLQPFPHVGKLVYLAATGGPTHCASCNAVMVGFAALYGSRTVKFNYQPGSSGQYVFSFCRLCHVVHGCIYAY